MVEFFNSCRLLAGGIVVRQCRMDYSRSHGLALRLYAITGGLGKAFSQLAVARRRVAYLLTTGGIVGIVGLKDVRSVLADFCSSG